MKTLTALKQANRILEMMNETHIKSLTAQQAYIVEEEGKARRYYLTKLSRQYANAQGRIDSYISKVTPFLSVLITRYEEQLHSYMFQKNQAISDCNIGVISGVRKLAVKFKINASSAQVRDAKSRLESLLFVLNYKGMNTPVQPIEYVEPSYFY